MRPLLVSHCSYSAQVREVVNASCASWTERGVLDVEGRERLPLKEVMKNNVRAHVLYQFTKKKNTLTGDDDDDGDDDDIPIKLLKAKLVRTFVAVVCFCVED